MAVGEDEVLPQAHLADDAVAVAVLRDAGHAFGGEGGGVPSACIAASQAHHACPWPAQAGEHTGETGLPVAGDPGDADDLVRVRGERRLAQERTAAGVVDLHLRQLQNRPAGGQRLADGGRHRAAHHQLGQAPPVGLGDRQVGHPPAAAQDHDAVAQGQDLGQLVGDEDQAHAALGQAPQDAEQLLDLGRGEHGRGLVQDQDAGVAVEHLQDLDPLPLADRKAAHRPVEVDVESGAAHQAAQLAPGGTALLAQAEQGPGAEDDVVEPGEVVRQREVLVDHPDPGCQRRLGRARRQRPQHAIAAGDLDRPLVGQIVAEEDAHQCGLAGTVLAQQAHDLALAQCQVDGVVGSERTEALGDAGQAQEGDQAPASAKHGAMTITTYGEGLGSLSSISTLSLPAMISACFWRTRFTVSAPISDTSRFDRAEPPWPI